jgi:AcrR family transcriptional regulator
MGRRPRFTREEVEDAAIRVVDRRGLDGLTMRAMGNELGTGAMTLYSYVADRAELDGLVVDGVLRELRLPDGPSTDWRADVHLIAEQAWRVVRRHPNAIPLILARRSRSPRFLDIAEALLAALARSGLTGHALLAAFRAVSTLATAFALNELGGPVSERGGGAAATIERFRGLPAERYRHLVEIATAARGSDPAVELHLGIEALLTGFAPGG